MVDRATLKTLKRTMSSAGLFKRFPNETKSTEIIMWRGVLDRAILDILDKDEANDFQDTLDWFDLHNDDFRDVCSFAELDPEFVIESAERVFKLFEEFFEE